MKESGSGGDDERHRGAITSLLPAKSHQIMRRAINKGNTRANASQSINPHQGDEKRAVWHEMAVRDQEK